MYISLQSVKYDNTLFKIWKFSIIKYYALMYTPYYTSA